MSMIFNQTEASDYTVCQEFWRQFGVFPSFLSGNVSDFVSGFSELLPGDEFRITYTADGGNDLRHESVIFFDYIPTMPVGMVVGYF